MTDKPTVVEPSPVANDNPIPRKTPEYVLRRMNHVEWLNQFSQVLGMRAPGSPPMTPMREGAIQRLKLAAEYIELLKKDLWRAQNERRKDGDEKPDDFLGR